ASEVPALLTGKPEELLRHSRRHSGIWVDGCLDKDAACMLRSSSADVALRLSGMVPFGQQVPDFHTTVTFRIDGEPAGDRHLGKGQFPLRLPVNLTPGPHLVELRFSDTHRLSSLDARQSAMHLTGVGFVGDAGQDRRPILERVADSSADFSGIAPD